MTEQRGTHMGYSGSLGQVLAGYNIRCIRLLPESDSVILSEEANSIWADSRTLEVAVHNADIEQGDHIPVVYADDHHVNKYRETVAPPLHFITEHLPFHEE